MAMNDAAFDEMIEQHIRGLQWVDGTPEREKTIVAGNIRGFAARFRASLVDRPMRTDYAVIGQEIGNLVQDKNKAYGSSFEKTGAFLRLLYPAGITPDQYDDALLLVRIFDKQMRIANQKHAFGESPYRDIAGYGILGEGIARSEGKE